MNARLISTLLILLVISFYGCNNNDNDFDASGVFEATEVVISAESNGKILNLSVEEGTDLSANQKVGLIDTVQLFINLQQLEASKAAMLTSKPNIRVQIEATQKEIEKQEYEKERVENLLKGDAATQKQLDDINSSLQVLNARLNAQKSSLSTSTNTVDAQSRTVDAQMKLIRNQIDKSIIASPIAGTVLSKYAEAGEVANFGKPLFRIADLSQIYLKAYVSGAQLPEIKLGQKVRVVIDGDNETVNRQGTITWIAENAEFTPKFVQTKEERVNLVYAIKVKVANQGELKIGMPGEVYFN